LLHPLYLVHSLGLILKGVLAQRHLRFTPGSLLSFTFRILRNLSIRSRVIDEFPGESTYTLIGLILSLVPI
jgi:hypothetical protein